MLSLLWLIAGLAGQQLPVPEINTLSAQQRYVCVEPPDAQRDAAGRPRAPLCASIEGQVVRGNSNFGIANAHVLLGPPEAGALSEQLEVVADADGRFSFPSVNNGRYSVVASADGYQTSGFNQAGLNGRGEVIIIRGGQHRQVTIKLNPYLAMSGTVRTADFNPVPAALVRGYSVRYSPLGRRLRIVRKTLTSDLGEYRLMEVEPGDYYVSASYNEPARDISVPGLKLTPNLTKPDAGFVTEFYPSGVSSAEGSAFTVRPREEKNNLNITLKDSDRFTVHATAYSATNELPHHFNLAFLPAGADLGDVEEYSIKGKGDGDFTISNIGPGHYSLVAFDKSRILSEAMPLTVDRNMDVKIPVYDPLDVPGIIVDEQGNSVTGTMSVRLVRTDPELGQTIAADVNSGNFMVQDLGPGAYDVYVDGLPSFILGALGDRYYIKDVQFPVNDMHFGRIRIEPDKPKRILDPTTNRWICDCAIRIVLAKSNAIVTGFVWDGARNRLPGATVVLIPERQPENPYAQREDHFIAGSSDSGGYFRFIGVPPGNYFAYAYEDIQAGLYFDSTFNERISSRGARVKATLDRPFIMTELCTPPRPPYVDPWYQDPNRNPIVPPPDSACLVEVKREETIGAAQ